MYIYTWVARWVLPGGEVSFPACTNGQLLHFTHPPPASLAHKRAAGARGCEVGDMREVICLYHGLSVGTLNSPTSQML